MIKHCLSLFAWLKAWQPQAGIIVEVASWCHSTSCFLCQKSPTCLPCGKFGIFQPPILKSKCWHSVGRSSCWGRMTFPYCPASSCFSCMAQLSLCQQLVWQPNCQSHSPVCPVESLASWTSTGRSSCILHNDLPILLCQQLFLMSSTTWKVWPLQCKAILLQNADLHVRMLMASRVKTAWRFFVWHREPINRKSHVPLSKQNQKWLFCLTSWTHQ